MRDWLATLGHTRGHNRHAVQISLGLWRPKIERRYKEWCETFIWDSTALSCFSKISLPPSLLSNLPFSSSISASQHIFLGEPRSGIVCRLSVSMSWVVGSPLFCYPMNLHPWESARLLFNLYKGVALYLPGVTSSADCCPLNSFLNVLIQLKNEGCYLYEKAHLFLY